MSAQKTKSSETETRELLGRTEENSVSPMRGHWFALQENKWFLTKRKQKKMSLWPDLMFIEIRNYGWEKKIENLRLQAAPCWVPAWRELWSASCIALRCLAGAGRGRPQGVGHGESHCRSRRRHPSLKTKDPLLLSNVLCHGLFMQGVRSFIVVEWHHS